MARHPKFYRYFIPGIILLILFAFTTAGLAQATDPVIVRIIPEDARVVLNQTIDIAVEVVDVRELYGIDILLEFDPQAVEVVDKDPILDGIQVQLGEFLEPGFSIINLADNEIGRLRVAMTQLNPAPPKDGTGNIVVVTFRAKAVRPTGDITIISAKLADPFGGLIEVEEIEDGSLTVVTSLVGPTNTSIPGQPVGTPLPTATNTPIPSITPTRTNTLPATATVPSPTRTITPTGDTPTPSARATRRTPSATPTLTSTVEGSPSMTLTRTAMAQATGTSQAATPTRTLALSEAEGGNGISAWWLLIPGGAVLGGLVVFLMRKKNTSEPEEFV
jgi:hypothetical protein